MTPQTKPSRARHVSAIVAAMALAAGLHSRAEAQTHEIY